MKTILILVLFVFSLNAYSGEKSCEQSSSENVSSEQLARRGCCSHHGGVCNCSGGRVVCCDGQFSPSCTCNKEDNKDVIYSFEESTKG
jgi:hypothetical protein